MHQHIKQSDIVKSLSEYLFDSLRNAPEPDTDDGCKRMLSLLISGWVLDNEIEFKYKTPPGGNLR